MKGSLTQRHRKIECARMEKHRNNENKQKVRKQDMKQWTIWDPKTFSVNDGSLEDLTLQKF